jgi:hypothetical protein
VRAGRALGRSTALWRAPALIAALVASQGAVALLSAGGVASAAGTVADETIPTITATTTTPVTTIPTITVTTTTPVTTITTTTPRTTAAPKPTPAKARLLGTFMMRGRLTVAVNVAGEYPGQRVTRLWSFRPTCRRGACRTVDLIRQRGADARNRIVLHRRKRALYVGHGTFYAPLKCNGRVIAHGERVPFKLTVKITVAADVGRVVIADRVHATYSNSRRTNLTSCVAFPGHDAATYTGRIIKPGTAPYP